MVVARDMLLKGLAFFCIFGLVLGFAYEDAGRPVMTWEVFWQGVELSCIAGATLCFIVVGADRRTISWGVFLKAVVFCTIAVVVLGFAYKGAKRFDISWEFLVIGAVFVALLELSFVLLMRMRRKGISRGVSFLKFLVFSCVVGAVVGLAHVGAKHMGGRWFVISNNGVFLGTIGLVPLFALEGVRCVRVLLGWCLKRMSISLSHGRGL
ncbi:hypothetical protein [Bartonella sp. AU18XJBT]|uniref:hypothetical protein n=1 Tax=Bartonella sp. AU18XJBT TaxID=3019089 RepID=UPI00235F1AC5|nr:hypothetical protein [Bartonella sp. AU18XJBT]